MGFLHKIGFLTEDPNKKKKVKKAGVAARKKLNKEKKHPVGSAGMKNLPLPKRKKHPVGGKGMKNLPLPKPKPSPGLKTIKKQVGKRNKALQEVMKW